MNRNHWAGPLPFLRRLTALTAALVVATAACNDATAPTGPTPSASTPALDGRSTSTASLKTLLQAFVTCGAQTYRKTVQTVGPSGGVILAGKHSLWIPAGALSAPVTITMEQMADSVVNVRFSPDGLTFNAANQPTLALNVIGCKVPAGVTPSIAYVTDSLAVISVLPSTWDATKWVVSAKLPHFSRYAVHY